MKTEEQIKEAIKKNEETMKRHSGFNEGSATIWQSCNEENMILRWILEDEDLDESTKCYRCNINHSTELAVVFSQQSGILVEDSLICFSCKRDFLGSRYDNVIMQTFPLNQYSEHKACEGKGCAPCLHTGRNIPSSACISAADFDLFHKKMREDKNA